MSDSPTHPVGTDDGASQVTADASPDAQHTQQGLTDDSLFLGNLEELILNTPTKQGVKSGVWKDIKRLPESRRGEYGRKTHVCVAKMADGAICRKTLRLSKQPGSKIDDKTARSWQTNVANAHLRDKHSTCTQFGEASLKRKVDEELRKEVVMFKQGMAQDGMNRSGGGLSSFQLTREERCLTSQVL